MAKNIPKDAAACALRILALREHTAFELSQKLKLRGFEPAEIEQALNQCREWNYLNDDRAALILAKTLMRKGCGLNKIVLELGKRKVARETINAVIDELGLAESQLEAALALVNKKFAAPPAAAEIYRQKGKIFRYLQGKGYSAEVIYRVFGVFYAEK